MKIKKICEYLSDIGLLQMTDINRFLTIYSQIDQNKCKKETDRLKISLFSYINTISKDDNQLFNMCRNIIDSFLNNQIVLKFRTLNIFYNILKNKISLRYNTFFYKLKMYVLNKRKNKKIVQPIYNSKKLSILENNDFQIKNENKRNKFNLENIKNNPKDRITVDDAKECTFTPFINEYKPYKFKQNDEKVKSYTYYTPSFNIVYKGSNHKNIQNRIRTYNYLNQNNINDSNLNNINNNTYNENKNRNCSFSQNNIDYLNELNGEFNKKRLRTPRQTSINDNAIFNQFLLKQDKHVKDVENKIMKLKIEERNKEEKECSFSPEINIYNRNNIKNNEDFCLYQNNYNNKFNEINNYKNRNYKNICPKFEGSLNNDDFSKELYNLCPQSNKNKKRTNSISKEFFNKLSNEGSEKNLRIEERRKNDMNKYTFSPKINHNNKNKVKSSFEERQKDYINSKKRLENKKDEDEKIFIEEMNKMYMPKSKSKDIIKRLYDNEAVKIKERIKDEKEKEKKNEKKKVINWAQRYKDNKKSKNKNFKSKSILDIYEISRKKNHNDNNKILYSFK
jgi:hypothetical protein